MNEESEKIMAKLRALKPVLQSQMGIKRLRVFGSVARGMATENSDVDLIAYFDRLPGLLGFVGIKQDIEERLGRKIDLFTEKSVDKYIRKTVLSEARDV